MADLWVLITQRTEVRRSGSKVAITPIIATTDFNRYTINQMIDDPHFIEAVDCKKAI